MKNPLQGPQRIRRSSAASWLENYDQRHRRNRRGRPGSLDGPTVRALRLAHGTHGAVKDLSRCWGISYATAKDAANRRSYKHVLSSGPVREVTPEERIHGNRVWLQERTENP